MLKSRTLKEKFTTFLDISTNKYGVWRKSIEFTKGFDTVCRNSDPSRRDSEQFWIEYWLEQSKKTTTDLPVIQSNQPKILLPPAHHYLVCYLEETVYFTTKKAINDFASLNLSHSELMQVARVELLDLEKFSKFFGEYDRTRGSFNKFAGLKVGASVSEFLCMKTALRKYSPTGLLRVVTPKYLKEALINYGTIATNNTNLLAQYFLAWQCFKEIYVPRQEARSQRLEWPNRPQLESIVARYNQLVCQPLESKRSSKSTAWLQSGIISLENISINSKTIDEYLNICVRALNLKISPPIDSLDRPLINSSDNNHLTLGDTVENERVDLARDEIIEEQESRSREWNEIERIILNSYDRLPSQDRKILQLDLGISITQTDIARIFGLIDNKGKEQQYKVSRSLSRSKKPILKDMVAWSLDRFNVTPQKIDDISQAIDDCLSKYIRGNCSWILGKYLAEQGTDLVELFNLHYRTVLPLNMVAERLNISESTAREKLARMKEQLCLVLVGEIQKDLPVSLDSSESDNLETTVFIGRLNKCISTFVDTWTENAPHAEIERELQNQDK
jgi:hypothetical protein